MNLTQGSTLWPSTATANLSDESDYDVMVKTFSAYYMGFLAVLGCFGNVYCIAAYAFSESRYHGPPRYLIALSCSDLGFVLCMSLTLMKFFKIYWQGLPGVCQLTTYVSSVCCFLSGWLVVALTAERCLAVWSPYLALRVCTPTRTTYLIVLLTLVAAVLNSPLVYLAKSISDFAADGTPIFECSLDPNAGDIYQAFTSADTVISFSIPLVVTLVLNVIIACCLCHALHVRRALTTPTGTGFAADKAKRYRLISNNNNNGKIRRSSSSLRRSTQFSNLAGIWRDSGAGLGSVGGADQRTTTTTSSTKSSRLRPSLPVSRRESPLVVKASRQQRKITSLLIAKSTAYLILNLPNYVHRVFLAFQNPVDDDLQPENYTSDSNTVERLVYLLFYTQFSVNFLLHSFSACTSGICSRKSSSKSTSSFVTRDIV